MADYWDRYEQKAWYPKRVVPPGYNQGRPSIWDTWWQTSKPPYRDGGPIKNIQPLPEQPAPPQEPGDKLGGRWVWDEPRWQWIWASEPLAPPQPGGLPGPGASDDVNIQPAPVQQQPYRPQRQRFGYWDPMRGTPRLYNPPSQDMINMLSARRNQRIGYWDPTRSPAPPPNIPQNFQQTVDRTPMGYWEPTRGGR